MRNEPENCGWAAERGFAEGNENEITKTMIDGSLKAVTDGLSHLDEHVAMAAVHVEANEGTTLTLVLRTPGTGGIFSHTEQNQVATLQ